MRIEERHARVSGNREKEVMAPLVLKPKDGTRPKSICEQRGGQRTNWTPAYNRVASAFVSGYKEPMCTFPPGSDDG